MIRRPPRPTPFPYPTLFRSVPAERELLERGSVPDVRSVTTVALLRHGEIRDLLLVEPVDRKSTRLNSSHQIISYAVFCLKKKKTHDRHTIHASHLHPPLRDT